jgi:hypothetical protein
VLVWCLPGQPWHLLTSHAFPALYALMSVMPFVTSTVIDFLRIFIYRTVEIKQEIHNNIIFKCWLWRVIRRRVYTWFTNVPCSFCKLLRFALCTRLHAFYERLRCLGFWLSFPTKLKTDYLATALSPPTQSYFIVCLLFYSRRGDDSVCTVLAVGYVYEYVCNLFVLLSLFNSCSSVLRPFL